MSADKLKVLFVAGFGPIVREDASRKLYVETLGLPLKRHATNPAYYHTSKIEGVKEFALWSLADAAESCFDAREWPAHLPVPNAWLEFEVGDIAAATRQLESEGYALLTALRMEPWGQTVTRFLSPEGMLVAVTHSPWLRQTPATPAE